MYGHIILFQKDDVYELRRYAYSDTVDSNTVKTLLRKVFPPCQCSEQSQGQQTLPTSSTGSTYSPPTISSPRSCDGHKRIIPIEEMSQSLDVNKECIATFLCYLEQRNWLRIINIFNDTCKLKWSGGEAKLKALSQKVSAVAEAVKLAGNGN